eukprot:PRCOL_00005158-RA
MALAEALGARPRVQALGGARRARRRDAARCVRREPAPETTRELRERGAGAVCRERFLLAGHKAALEAFVEVCVEAYALGYSSDSLLAEARGTEGAAEGTQDAAGGGVGPAALLLREPMSSNEFAELEAWVGLVFLAVDATGAVPRWTPAEPGRSTVVGEATAAAWGGFAAHISDAYARGWSACDVQRLTALQLVAQGRADRPDVVAELGRLVFAALAYVVPQFPS